jgi:hypothetical protein
MGSGVELARRENAACQWDWLVAFKNVASWVESDSSTWGVVLFSKQLDGPEGVFQTGSGTKSSLLRAGFFSLGFERKRDSAIDG